MDDADEEAGAQREAHARVGRAPGGELTVQARRAQTRREPVAHAGIARLDDVATVEALAEEHDGRHRISVAR